MVKSISLKKERKKYNKLVGIIAVVFLVCLLVAFLFQQFLLNNQRKLVKLLSKIREYQLIDRAYFPKNKRLDVLFFTN